MCGGRRHAGGLSYLRYLHRTVDRLLFWLFAVVHEVFFIIRVNECGCCRWYAVQQRLVKDQWIGNARDVAFLITSKSLHPALCLHCWRRAFRSLVPSKRASQLWPTSPCPFLFTPGENECGEYSCRCGQYFSWCFCSQCARRNAKTNRHTSTL